MPIRLPCGLAFGLKPNSKETRIYVQSCITPINVARTVWTAIWFNYDEKAHRSEQEEENKESEGKPPHVRSNLAINYVRKISRSSECVRKNCGRFPQLTFYAYVKTTSTNLLSARRSRNLPGVVTAGLMFSCIPVLVSEQSNRLQNNMSVITRSFQTKPL